MRFNVKFQKIFLFLLIVLILSGLAIFVLDIKKRVLPFVQIIQDEPAVLTNKILNNSAQPITNQNRNENRDKNNNIINNNPTERQTFSSENKQYQPTQSISSRSAAISNEMPVALMINEKNYQTDIKEGSSAFDLMEKLKKESDLSFSGQDYAGLGFFVEEINGIKNDPLSKKYWFFYINNKKANQGISSVKLKTNDLITWKYETYAP